MISVMISCIGAGFDQLQAECVLYELSVFKTMKTESG